MKYIEDRCIEGGEIEIYAVEDEEIYDEVGGELLESGEECFQYNGGWVSVDDIGDYFICQDCGEVLNRYNDYYEIIHTDSSDYYDEPYMVCDSCANNHYSYCEGCDRWFENSVMNDTEDGERCDDCFSEYYECCDCGEYVHRDNGHFDRNDDFWCDYCWDNREEVISDYHSHHGAFVNYNANGKVNDWEMTDEDKLRVAWELEVEDGNLDREEEAKRIIELMDNHIYCERDCSLDDDTGMEIISHPHTVDAFYKLPLKAMLKKLSDDGFTSHDNEDCGLHIHVSNEWFGNTSTERDDNIAKVVHLYSEEYEFFRICSRRDEDEARRWAHALPCEDYEDAKVKMTESRSGWDADRYVAVNTQNVNGIGTVEYRLGRGTLRYESFMAWVDMHIAITRNAQFIDPNDLDLNKWLGGISNDTKAYIYARTGRMVI